MTEKTNLTDLDPKHEALNVVINALKPLSIDQQRSVLNSAANYFSLPLLSQQGSGSGSQSDVPDLQSFVFERRTDNDAIAVTVLAYYLLKYRNRSKFKAADLDALNTEAGTGKIFGNIYKTVNNATQRNRFLSKTGDGFKQIAPLGRLVVEALPDEEKVEALLEKNKPKPKRKTRKKNAKESKEV